MLRACIGLVLTLIPSCYLSTAWGQQPPRPGAAPKLGAAKPGDPGAITNLLKGNDNFQIQQAVQSAIEMLSDEKNAAKAAAEVPNWLKLLLAQKRLDEVEELALAAIVAQPTQLPLLEKSQEFRVRAKLVADKPKEALALAKALYNVCAMPSTSRAIDMVSECLYDANKDADPASIVKQYKLQQIRGAAVPDKAAPVASEKLMLSEVQVDGKAYQETITGCDLKDDAFSGLLAKGNLLLLADQPKEARKVFEKAYSLASDKNLAAATEGVARAMRAEDGTVGRANAWILSLRPQEGGF